SRVRQLARQVIELDREHVEHVERRAARDSRSESRRQVSVHTRNLERAPVEPLAECRQRRVPETAEIAPQDQIDEPLALEDAYGTWVNVRPPVGLQQVGRQGRGAG